LPAPAFANTPYGEGDYSSGTYGGSDESNETVDSGDSPSGATDGTSEEEISDDGQATQEIQETPFEDAGPNEETPQSSRDLRYWLTVAFGVLCCIGFVVYLWWLFIYKRKNR